MSHIRSGRRARSIRLSYLSVLAVLAGTASLMSARAAEPGTPAPQSSAECAPGAGKDAPVLGNDRATTLSEELAQSHGVLCPPQTLDSEMPIAPPGGGKLKVIPPPVTPGDRAAPPPDSTDK